MEKKNKIDIEANENLKAKLILKYLKRFHEVCNDLINNGYLPVLAKQKAIEVISIEYLKHNPYIESEITCQAFYSIGDLSQALEFKSKKTTKIDTNKVITTDFNKLKYF